MKSLSLFLCFLFAGLQANSSPILELLKVVPSEQSLDYVANKKQFQLHELLTEQRHPRTYHLSTQIQADTKIGIEALLSVDEDISAKFLEISGQLNILEQAAQAVEDAILQRRKIYVYGCGATGRLAKQMESTFWRPFWKKLYERFPKSEFKEIENLLIGEMTGADRALISSLEGFEDLMIIGKLQLADHQIQADDVIFAITEGGETSSVIGTLLAAIAQSAAGRKFFIYNNPDSVLLPFDRSQAVLENESVTKIPLFTGPQAITGSTRMQATTSETFVLGIILEQAIHSVLKRHLSEKELTALGFPQEATLRSRLLSFLPVQQAVSKIAREISLLTNCEAETYAKAHFSTYFAKRALMTVFIDATERSPTFRLYPLDTVREPARKAWIQVWTPAQNGLQAWHNLLGRPFRGLDPLHYQEAFLNHIDDSYLQKSALNSLKNAGDDQQFLYDFSFSEANVQRSGPASGDLGVMILTADEIEELLDKRSPFCTWLKVFSGKRAKIGVILLPDQQLPPENPILRQLKEAAPHALIVQLPISIEKDPLGLRQQIGLKMLLNAHSTGVMAKLGRVVGNTMTNVNPGNLKLIGRATFLIKSHVNDYLPPHERITYAEANAILFAAMAYTKQHQKQGQISEVALSIVRILEASRQKSFLSWEEAEKIGLSDLISKLEKPSQ